MIKPIEGLANGVLGFEASGRVRGEDYEEVLLPAIEERLAEGGKLSFLYVLGEQFDGYSAAAMWDDTKLGIKHPFAWERVALVTDNEHYAHMVKVFAAILPADVRVFPTNELDAAKTWVGEPHD